MPTPTEIKTVKSRILKYVQEIGWTYVNRNEAEKRRGFNGESNDIKEKCRTASMYFEDLLYSKVKEFNPKYRETEGSLIRLFNSFKTDIFGNRDFLKYLRNEGTFYDKGEKRDLNLILIDYSNPQNNRFEVTEEFYWYNGRFGNREDIVFLINGIPALVIECKNATKDEAVALGIDQIRRYHRETPEFFVPEQIFTATDALGFSYGVSWNTIRRNIFNWKIEELGNPEKKVKTFCPIPQVLKFLKEYILFSKRKRNLKRSSFGSTRLLQLKRFMNARMM